MILTVYGCDDTEMIYCNRLVRARAREIEGEREREREREQLWQVMVKERCIHKKIPLPLHRGVCQRTIIVQKLTVTEKKNLEVCSEARSFRLLRHENILDNSDVLCRLKRSF